MLVLFVIGELRMQKGFDKYIATILIFLQIGMLLPAESFAELGRRAGMERLDRYLEKAARENDEQRWEELSAQGIAAAIADWESIYLYEKEQSEERQKEKDAFIKDAKKKTAKQYMEWVSERFFSMRLQMERNAFTQRLKEEAEKRYAEKKIIKSEEVAGVRDEWKRDVDSAYIQEYFDKWADKNGLYESEIRKLTGEKRLDLLGEEEAARIIQDRRERFGEYVRREYEKISEAEENALVGRLLYDTHSLKKLKEEEAAKAVADKLAFKAAKEANEGMDELFRKLDTQAEKGQSSDIEVESRRWLESFRVEFEKALKLWDEAEKTFIVKRLEWEEEAQEQKERSEKAWFDAYEQLMQKKDEWRQKVAEKLKEGREKWQTEKAELEKVLTAASAEFEAAGKKEREEKEHLIDMHVGKYEINRKLLLAALEGIQNWHGVWSGKYRAVYAYWKTEGAASDDEWKAKAGNLESLETNLKKWKEYAIKHIFEICKTQKENLENRLSKLNVEKTVQEKQLESLKERLAQLERPSLEESGRSFWDKNSIEKQIGDVENSLKAIEEEIKHKQDRLQKINEALAFGKEDGILAKENEIYAFSGKRIDTALNELIVIGVLDQKLRGTFFAYEDITTWIKKAKSYKANIEQAARSLTEMTGSIFVTTSDGYEYIDELKAEKLKAQSVSRYWQRELEIAQEVDRYARDESSNAQWKEETLERLAKARAAYEKAYKAYEKTLEKMDRTEGRINEQQKLIEKTKGEMTKLQLAVEDARKQYGYALAAMRNVKKESAEAAIAEYAFRLSAIWKDTEGKEKQNRYYSALWAYTQEGHKEDTEKHIYELVQGKKEGTGIEKESLASLKEKRERLQSLIDNKKFDEALKEEDCSDGALREKIAQKQKILQDENAPDAEKELAKKVLQELYTSVFQYWDEQVILREGTVRYIASGKTGLQGKLPTEEDKKESQLRSLLETEKVLIEWYKDGSEAEKKREAEERLKLITELLEKQGKSFIKEVEKKKDENKYVHDVLQSKWSFNAEEGMYIYANKTYAASLFFERIDSYIRAQGQYWNNEEKNKRHKEALKKITETIKQNESAEGVRFDTIKEGDALYEYLYGLERDADNAYENIREAVSEYIESVLEYKGVQAAAGGDWEQQIKETEKKIEDSTELYKTYAQFEKNAYNEKAYIQFLKTQTSFWETTGDNVKEACGRYLGALLLERMDIREKERYANAEQLQKYIASLSASGELLNGIEDVILNKAAAFITERLTNAEEAVLQKNGFAYDESKRFYEVLRAERNEVGKKRIKQSYELRYMNYAKRESENSRYAWSQTAQNFKVSEGKGLKNYEKDNILEAIGKATQKETLLRITQKIVNLTSYIRNSEREKEELDKEYTEEKIDEILKGGEKEFKGSTALSTLRIALEQAAQVKRQGIAEEQTLLRQLYATLKTLAGLQQDDAEKIAVLKRAEEAYTASYEKYTQKEKEYNAQNENLIKLFEQYNTELAQAETAFEQAEVQKLERDKALAVYEWAQSVYLESMGGENSRQYKTPKERLNEVRYKAVRARIAAQVLENLEQNTERSKGSSEYEAAWNKYAGAYEAYYASKVMQFEIRKELQVQEDRVREAEKKEKEALEKLITETSLALTEEEKKLLQTVKLTRVKNDDGTWTYNVETNFTVREYTVRIEDGTDPETGKTKYREEIYKKSIVGNGEGTKEEDLNAYFTEYTEEERLQDGVIKTSKAVQDAKTWLEQVFTKGEGYLNRLAMAFLYVRSINNGEIPGFDSNSKVPMQHLTGNIGNVHPGDMFVQNVKDILKESYDNADKADLARYILYRDTVLKNFNWQAREQNALYIEALNRTANNINTEVQKYANMERDAHKTAVYAACVGAAYLFLSFGTGISAAAASFATAAAAGIAEAIAKGEKEKFQKVCDQIRSFADGRSKEGWYKQKTDEYNTWQKEKRNLIDQKAKLERYYGENKDGSGINLEDFKTSVTELLKAAKGVAGKEDFTKYYEPLFNELSEKEKGSNAKALSALHAKLVEKERKAKEEFEAKAKKDAEKQGQEAKLFAGIIEEEMTISKEDADRLRQLAQKASDIHSSSAERKKAAKEYEKEAAKLTGKAVQKKLEKELTEQAKKAWGKNTWSKKEHGRRLEGLYSAHLRDTRNTRSDINRETETYVQEEIEQLKQSALKALDHSIQVKRDIQENERNLVRKRFKSQQEQWEEQALLIARLGEAEWQKAEGKLNSAHKEWIENFVKEVHRLDTEWTKNYTEFRESKQEWIDRQYRKANAVAAGTAAKALYKDEDDVLLSAQKAIKSRESFAQKSAFKQTAAEASGYVESLFDSAYLTRLDEAALGLNERILDGKRSAGSNVSARRKNGGNMQKLLAAEEAIKALNEEGRALAAKNAALNVQKEFAALEKAFEKRIEAENKGMKEWEENLVREQGYSVDEGSIRRKVIVARTLINGLIEEEQYVHKYEYFRYIKTDISSKIESGNLEGLNEYGIQLIVRQVQRDMQAESEKVFGKTDETGKTEGGLFNEHRGKASALKSGKDFDFDKGKTGNIADAGSGQIGKMLLDIQWNQIEASIGAGELNKGLHDVKLWDDRGSNFKAPSIRSITEIAVAVAATAVVSVATGGAGGVLLGAAIGAAMNLADDVVFAGIDLAGGYKSPEQVGNELGKKALSSAVSVALAGAGSFVNGLNAVKGLTGIAKTAFNSGMNMGQSYVGSVANKYIQSYDFATGNMDWNSANKSWYSADTIAGTLSAGITTMTTAGFAGMGAEANKFYGGAMKLGTAAAGKATEYGVHLAYAGGDFEKAYDNMGGITLNLANLGSIFDFAGSMSARHNGTGQSSLGNIARKFGGTGLLEMNIGRNGISMQLGMGGIDVGGALYDLGKRSYDRSMLQRYEREHGKDKGETAYSAYVYGDWTQEHTAARLASGKDELYFTKGKEYTAKTSSNGKGGRRIEITDSKDRRLNAIQLGHEAYRDGKVGGNNAQETIAAVLGHTGMAVRMEEDGKRVAGSDLLRAEMDAYKRGDMDALLMNALTNYDSTDDYWKLMEDGSLAYDGDGWLKDSNGNQIYDEDGNPIGSNGIETGLRKILKVDETEARRILRNSHFIADDDSATPWKNELNEDRKITLNNSLYAEKYNERLFHHNTLNIYNQLVDVGLMDYHSVDYDIEQYSGNEWNGRQPDVKFISYKEWKANNFISRVSKKMLFLQEPVKARISSPYGKRTHPVTGANGFHAGIDWAVAEGTEFYPFATGKVSSIYTSDKLGNVLTLEHEMKYTFKGKEIKTSLFSVYMHMQNNSTGGVRTPYTIGDTVHVNNIAGYSGSTGTYVRGAHLHAGMYFTSLKDNPYANWLYMHDYITKPKEFVNYYTNPYFFIEN